MGQDRNPQPETFGRVFSHPSVSGPAPRHDLPAFWARPLTHDESNQTDSRCVRNDPGMGARVFTELPITRAAGKTAPVSNGSNA